MFVGRNVVTLSDVWSAAALTSKGLLFDDDDVEGVRELDVVVLGEKEWEASKVAVAVEGGGGF